MCLLTLEKLRKIGAIDYILEISKYCEDAFDIILNGETSQEFEFDYCTADVFLKGECQLFAIALNHIHPEYKICYFNKMKAYHVFCEFNEKYIDVRGKMNSLTELSSVFNVVINKDDIHEYIRKADDWNNQYSEIGYAFALEIIKSEKERYNIEA